MKTEKIEIEVPAGKAAKDTRPVTERIKTFKDAAHEVGIEDPEDWEANYADIEPDILAYFKLRIICKALNEGWKPQFAKDECRYYPWLRIYTKDEIEDMSENNKSRIINTCNYVTEYEGFACSHSHYVTSTSGALIGSLLCLKDELLAVYCGKQFIDIWADFVLIRR